MVSMSKPLDGVLVVAVEQAVAAPLCTSRLLDAGARVIKIERAGGDFARFYDTAALGDSSYFAWNNPGKESIVLDITDEIDANILHNMLRRADVLVQNLSPGALDRRGFDRDILIAANPKLINCNISGYGNSEELRGMKAYDLLVQAETGLVSVSGGPGELGRIGVSLCDIGAGVTAYAAILEALLLRAKTLKGTEINISLFDVAAEWMSVPYIHTNTGSGAPARVGLRHPSIAPYGAFTDCNGILTLLSIQNEREWYRLCHDVLNLASLCDDDRFNSNEQRVENRDELEEAINSATGKLETKEFRSALLEASIAYGAVNSVEDLLVHPALRTRPVINTHEQLVTIPAHPCTVGQSPSSDQPRPVPKLNEHGDALREEFQ